MMYLAHFSGPFLKTLHLMIYLDSNSILRVILKLEGNSISISEKRYSHIENYLKMMVLLMITDK